MDPALSRDNDDLAACELSAQDDVVVVALALALSAVTLTTRKLLTESSSTITDVVRKKMDSIVFPLAVLGERSWLEDRLSEGGK
mmetsp:Transcript_18144/g.32407  ORF Transcript_18144/g.32407 Transcript_18144/m.32407 type:complete len:84 (+) Transcript_18144:1164-1415(+)